MNKRKQSEQMSKYKKHQGFSLVELLVAMTISLLLMAGISQIYLANKQSYNFQQDEIVNMENARYGMLLLQGFIREAGRRPYPWQNIQLDFPIAGAVAGCAFPAAGQVVNTVANGICIRLKGPVVDCNGNNVDTNTMSVMRFHVNQNQLKCQADSTVGAAANTGADIVLVDNISNLAITYGEDTDPPSSDFSKSINRFVPANVVSDWTDILAVRLIMTNSKDNGTDYNYFTTITLRNMTQ